MSDISYEKAVELKRAGFPQHGRDVMTPHTADIAIGRESVHYPSLPELIEACGDDFDLLCHDVRGVLDPLYKRGMQRSNKHWSASSWSRCTELGDNPEEAVANLYIALHRPQ